MNNIIESNKILLINNKLRSLGLNSSLIGTKHINKVIQIVISSNTEFYYLEDIYLQISSYYPSLSPSNIRNAIKYALDNRNETLCKKNFEKIFDFEYDDVYFEPKNFIEEIANIIKINLYKYQ